MIGPLLFGIAALGVAPGAGTSPGAENSIEHAVKAALVYKVARFVDWPEGDACPGDVVTIAVLGQSWFGDAIDRAVEGRTLAGRSVQVRHLTRVDDVPDCSVLWLGNDDARRLEGATRQTRDRSVILVGDGPGFARRGGMIGLVVENERLVIEVNTEAAASASVKISSRLLGLARLVKPAPAAKDAR